MGVSAPVMTVPVEPHEQLGHGGAADDDPLDALLQGLARGAQLLAHAALGALVAEGGRVPGADPAYRLSVDQQVADVGDEDQVLGAGGPGDRGGGPVGVGVDLPARRVPGEGVTR